MVACTHLLKEHHSHIFPLERVNGLLTMSFDFQDSFNRNEITNISYWIIDLL